MPASPECGLITTIRSATHSTPVPAELPPETDFRSLSGAPLPGLARRPWARGVVRGLHRAFGGTIREVRGVERVRPACDPLTD